MRYIEPKARLVTYTINPLIAIYKGYRMCTTPIGPIETRPIEEMEAFVRKRLKAEHAHESVLEHASFTFDIVCSRAASHQLVRHRIASYSQQSQRYCWLQRIEGMVPEAIDLDNECKERFDRLQEMVEETYRYYILRGIKPEDARCVLTQATATKLRVTMNCRALRNFFAERLCNRAQAEIRQLAWSMLEQCREVLPCVFENVAQPCVKAGHCVEEDPCGEQPWKQRG